MQEKVGGWNENQWTQPCTADTTYLKFKLLGIVHAGRTCSQWRVKGGGGRFGGLSTPLASQTTMKPIYM